MTLSRALTQTKSQNRLNRNALVGALKSAAKTVVLNESVMTNVEVGNAEIDDGKNLTYLNSDHIIKHSGVVWRVAMPF